LALEWRGVCQQLKMVGRNVHRRERVRARFRLIRTILDVDSRHQGRLAPIIDIMSPHLGSNLLIKTA
jgi:hypothetical protein